MGTAFAQTGSSDTKAAARSGFKGYGPGRRSKKKEIDVTESEGLRRLMKLWKKVDYSAIERKQNKVGLCTRQLFPWDPPEIAYFKGVTRHIQELTDRGFDVSDAADDSGQFSIIPFDVPYTAEDVEQFSILLADHQDEYRFRKKAGLFLSAIVNNGSDNKYTIRTSHLTRLPEILGEENCKDLVIKGDAYQVGHHMKSGSIIVKGNVIQSIGPCMDGGEIIIEGEIQSDMAMTGVIKGRVLHKGEVILEK